MRCTSCAPSSPDSTSLPPISLILTRVSGPSISLIAAAASGRSAAETRTWSVRSLPSSYHRCSVVTPELPVPAMSTSCDLSTVVTSRISPLPTATRARFLSTRYTCTWPPYISMLLAGSGLRPCAPAVPARSRARTSARHLKNALLRKKSMFSVPAADNEVNTAGARRFIVGKQGPLGQAVQAEWGSIVEVAQHHPHAAGLLRDGELLRLLRAQLEGHAGEAGSEFARCVFQRGAGREHQDVLQQRDDAAAFVGRGTLLVV